LLGIGWFLARDWLALYALQLGGYLATVTISSAVNYEIGYMKRDENCIIKTPFLTVFVKGDHIQPVAVTFSVGILVH
jgi:hypothetical protein